MPSNTEKLIQSLKSSGIFSELEISKLKSTNLPSPSEIESFGQEPEVSAILEDFSDQPNEQMVELQKLAKQYLEENQPRNAWKVILQD